MFRLLDSDVPNVIQSTMPAAGVVLGGNHSLYSYLHGCATFPELARLRALGIL